MIHSPRALWKERHRYLPAVLAVTFSAVLILMQFGLLVGLFSLTSIPIDQSEADLWVGHPAVVSCDLGRPIPEHWLGRVACQPEVSHVEECVQTVVILSKPGVRSELCLFMGTRLDDDSLGAIHGLTPQLRRKLSEPGGVVVDEADLDRLGLDGVGDVVDAFGKRVRVVGLMRGAKALTMPLVYCSLETVRSVSLNIGSDQIVYVLARCRSPSSARTVAHRLRSDYRMTAFTQAEFSRQTRWYWLTRTRAGLSTGWTALLGLLVGSVITSQTLYAATSAYRREYAVLRALGIPRWRLGWSVLTQGFWVGCAGVILAIPLSLGLSQLAGVVGVKILLPLELFAVATGVTLSMAMVSSLLALRSVWRIEPAELLR